MVVLAVIGVLRLLSDLLTDIDPTWATILGDSPLRFLRQPFRASGSDIPSLDKRVRRLGLGWWVADGHGVSKNQYLVGLLIVTRDGEALWTQSGYSEVVTRRLTRGLLGQIIDEIRSGSELQSMRDLASVPAGESDRFLAYCASQYELLNMKADSRRRQIAIDFLESIQVGRPLDGQKGHQPAPE